MVRGSVIAANREETGIPGALTLPIIVLNFLSRQGRIPATDAGMAARGHIWTHAVLRAGYRQLSRLA